MMAQLLAIGQTFPACRLAACTAALYTDRRGIDDAEAGFVDGQPAVPDKAYSAFEQRYYRYHRERHGYGADFGFEPPTGLPVYDAETLGREQQPGARAWFWDPATHTGGWSADPPRDA